MRHTCSPGCFPAPTNSLWETMMALRERQSRRKKEEKKQMWRCRRPEGDRRKTGSDFNILCLAKLCCKWNYKLWPQLRTLRTMERIHQHQMRKLRFSINMCVSWTPCSCRVVGNSALTHSGYKYMCYRYKRPPTIYGFLLRLTRQTSS